MKNRKLLIMVMLLSVILFIIQILDRTIPARAQEPTPQPTPQLACENKTKVFNLEPELVEAKVKELEAEGYCIHQSNFLVVGKQVLLIVARDDLQGAGTDDECDEGEDCE